MKRTCPQSAGDAKVRVKNRFLVGLMIQRLKEKDHPQHSTKPACYVHPRLGVAGVVLKSAAGGKTVSEGRPAASHNVSYMKLCSQTVNQFQEMTYAATCEFLGKPPLVVDAEYEAYEKKGNTGKKRKVEENEENTNKKFRA